MPPALRICLGTCMEEFVFGLRMACSFGFLTLSSASVPRRGGLGSLAASAFIPTNVLDHIIRQFVHDLRFPSTFVNCTKIVFFQCYPPCVMGLWTSCRNTAAPLMLTCRCVCTAGGAFYVRWAIATPSIYYHRVDRCHGLPRRRPPQLRDNSGAISLAQCGTPKRFSLRKPPAGM